MKHLGDITKIDGAVVEPVEVVIGGSPCQDLSVAGKREGLSGERSGLFMEQIRIIKEMRRKDIESGAVNPRPRYMVWENVPGAFSSNKGEDFRIVLEETARICDPTAVIPRPEGGRWTNSGAVMGAGWSIAWRVHDAQFWGVPQRRRRIALVADFRGATAPEILFERESVSRNFEESGAERKTTAADSDECSHTTNRMYDVTRRHEYTSECKVAPTVTALYGTGGGNTPVIVNDKSVLCVRERCGCDGGGKGLLIQKDKSATLAVSNDQMVVYEFPLGFRPENVRTYQEKSPTVCNGSRPGFCNGVVAIDRAAFNQGENAQYDFEISESGVNSTLVAKGTSAVSYSIGNGQADNLQLNTVGKTLNCMHDQQAIITLDRAAFNQGQNAQYDFKVDDEGVNSTIVSKGPSAICYGICSYDSNAMKSNNPNSGIYEAETTRTLDGNGGNPSCNQGGVAVYQSTVRRLTPLECERLQGFPTVRKVEFTKMTKDEYIAFNINEGNIIVDAEKGKVYGTRGPGGKKLSEPKELVGTILNGYRVVSIRNGQTKLQCRVHRIVWISKNGIIPDGYVVDHINNNKQDSRISNLQILTPKENSTKARKDGLYKTHEEAGQAKITNDVHDLIQYVYGNSDMSLRQLAEVFKISKSRISQIIHESGWTDIGEWTDSKGKKRKASDAARYKALGNSIALPFWAWMLERLSGYCEEHTMASLFDGIGGFPLIWETINGKGSCLWASEIEEFPIAVTKYHFGG